MELKHTGLVSFGHHWSEIVVSVYTCDTPGILSDRSMVFTLREIEGGREGDSNKRPTWDLVLQKS